MKYYVVSLAALFTVLLYGVSDNSIAGGNLDQVAADYQKADMKNGALLYDNWLKITKAKTEGNHPLYPSDAKKSGKSTWRCKECHGWDYIGNKGRYSKGSHYTGIAGTFQVRDKAPVYLYNSLTNKATAHDFSSYMSASQIWDLVKFLREGQAAIVQVIDDQGQAKGNTEQGKVLYDANCSSCHGTDGNDIDFNSSKEGTQGVGWLANDNPQESIHKIRWGHPGSNMPSMVVDKGLSEKDAIDILTYSQMLEDK